MRTINADELINLIPAPIHTSPDGQDLVLMSDVMEAIKRASTIEPERKTGKWIVTCEFEDCRYVKCDQCKVTQVFYYNKPLTNFCPDCGARMDGEKNDVPLTAGCKNAEKPISITWSDKTARKTKLYCRESGYLCEFATEYGYCQITVCVKEPLAGRRTDDTN